MKILYDYQVFSDQRYGGISRYFCELCSRLAACPGVSIDLAAGIITNGGLHALEPGVRARVAGWFMPRWVPRNRLFSAVNRQWFNRVAGSRGADLYHATYYRLLAADIPARRVLTVYDMIHERYPGYQKPGDPTASRKKAAVELADGIICLSQAAAQDLADVIPDVRGRVRVVYPGAPEWVRRDTPRRVTRPYVLFVGHRNGYKNFRVVLEALSRAERALGGLELVCFGGPPPRRRECAELARLGLAQRVRFVRGADSLLNSLYEHAAAFLYPSVAEGFGLPLLEAMAAGCPVLASRTKVFEEVAAEAALYFDPASPEACAQQLERVLHDPALRRQLVTAGDARVKAFSWAKAARETLDFYGQIAAQ